MKVKVLQRHGGAQRDGVDADDGGNSHGWCLWHSVFGSLLKGCRRVTEKTGWT